MSTEGKISLRNYWWWPQSTKKVTTAKQLCIFPTHPWIPPSNFEWKKDIGQHPKQQPIPPMMRSKPKSITTLHIHTLVRELHLANLRSIETPGSLQSRVLCSPILHFHLSHVITIFLACLMMSQNSSLFSLLFLIFSSSFYVFFYCTILDLS